MFSDIVMIDYAKPLAQRKRKHAGPYHWTPTKPGTGRGFYQSSTGLSCDRHGSTFDLRLEYAREHVERLRRVRGYYANDWDGIEYVPIIARLPHSRGFLAGWTGGKGMIASIAPELYDTIEDAAYAAYQDAERATEQQAEYEQAEREREPEYEVLPTYYHCGICEQYHNALWDGDCRNDSARFNVEDLDEKHGFNGWDEIEMDEIDAFRANVAANERNKS